MSAMRVDIDNQLVQAAAASMHFNGVGIVKVSADVILMLNGHQGPYWLEFEPVSEGVWDMTVHEEKPGGTRA